jgi:Asp-tRNA(Asn)/Glu-tRNA(Gln) amidotransferase A subunit family amidase
MSGRARVWREPSDNVDPGEAMPNADAWTHRSLGLILTALTLLILPPGAQPDQRTRGVAAPAQWPGDRFDVMEKSIGDLQAAMQARTIGAVDLVEIYLARIDAYDRRGPAINALISINPRARDDAAALDRERATRGPRGPLHGIPVLVKDNFDMAGLPTTAGSLALATLTPPQDAYQVRRLREAGAVILGKTNLHELASGITTISSLGGQTRNPYDPARNPGGSSGGTGAAIAANFAAAGLGTDTCGSIRIPAANNSLAGLRPTLGLSSRAGVVPLSHSQDVAGPLARTVADLATMLDATVGTDAADESTRAGDGRRPAGYRDQLREGALKGARIGILTSLFGDAPEDSEGGAIVRRALESMKKLGAETIDVTIPGLDQMLMGTSLIDAEFKFDLMDYLAKVPDAPVRSLGEILDRGLYHSAIEGSVRRRNAVEARETEQVRRARIKRATLTQTVLAAMEEHRLDALAYPTMRRKPALIGQPQAGSTCQLSASTALPALSLPAGFTDDGLPIGIELLGRAFDEPRLLGLAYSFEQATHLRRTPFSTPPLVGRTAPAPSEFVSTVTGQPATVSLNVRFTFDRTTGELRYQAGAAGVRAEDVLASWIHRGAEGERGAADFQILGPGELRRSGTILVPPAQRSALADGRLYLAFYWRGGSARTQLRFPSR